MHIKTPLVTEITLTAQNLRSLVWDGDTLIDWAGGGARYGLGGDALPSTFSSAFPFDAAVSSTDGSYAVIYQKLGTKGLVLERGKFLREINRSFYHACAYEYPITLARGPDGRDILIHCPDDYNRLEVEDVASGKRLTSSLNRKPSDFFHSRLSVSSDGRYLKSAGWLWHPIDDVSCYDLRLALSDPGHLDGSGLLGSFCAEESSAAFDATGRLWVAVAGDINDEEDLNEVRVAVPNATSPPDIFPMSAKLGTIFPIGDQHLLSLYEHPKLVALATGEIVQAWPHIVTGKQKSSILVNRPEVPTSAFALNPTRLAVAAGDKISVLMFDI